MMPALYAAAVAFFRFVIWEKGVQVALRSILFPKVVFINITIAALVVSYLAAVLNIVIFVYNKANDLINLIDKVTDGGSNEILTWAMEIFRALGVWNAFVDVFNIFSPVIASLVIIYAYKVGYKFLRSVREALVSLSIAKL